MPLVFLVVVVLWVFSVCLHEFGHAWVAYRGGDDTVVEKGYLSMNPVHYAHPVTSFLLPMLFMVVGGIGLPGGAVYINKHLLRSRGWETGVSLAGPAMNLALVIVLTTAAAGDFHSPVSGPRHHLCAGFSAATANQRHPVQSHSRAAAGRISGHRTLAARRMEGNHHAACRQRHVHFVSGVLVRATGEPRFLVHSLWHQRFSGSGSLVWESRVLSSGSGNSIEVNV